MTEIVIEYKQESKLVTLDFDLIKNTLRSAKFKFKIEGELRMYFTLKNIEKKIKF